MQVSDLEGVYLKGLELTRMQNVAAMLSGQTTGSLTGLAVANDLLTLLVTGRFSDTCVNERAALAARAYDAVSAITAELQAVGISTITSELKNARPLPAAPA